MLEDPQRGIITADVLSTLSRWKHLRMLHHTIGGYVCSSAIIFKSGKRVLGENVETGYIHTLKDNQRTAVPVMINPLTTP
jgi:DNA helicase-2/ATP-dependent DNA helicase PcrA